MAYAELTASGGAVCGHDSLLRDGSGNPILDGSGQYIETDQWLARAVVVTALGGAVAGGAADTGFEGGIVVQAVVQIGQGGAVCGHDSLLRDGSGNPILDGSGQYIETDQWLARAVVVAALGGAVAGGAADTGFEGGIVVQAVAKIGQGGAVCGHDSLLRDGSGNPILDGSGQYIETDQWLARAVVVAALGGAVAGGAAAVNAANVLQSVQQTGIGGAIGGGSAGATRAHTFMASGGSVSGGSATTAATGINIGTLVAAGGAVCGGGATARQCQLFEPVGGAVAGGSAVVAASGLQSVQYTGTGGALCAGTANQAQTAVAHVAGGAVVGGSASALSIHVAAAVHSAQGGAVAGSAGTVVVASATLGLGGCFGGGSAHAYVVAGWSGTGGAVCGGTGSPVGRRMAYAPVKVFVRAKTATTFVWTEKVTAMDRFIKQPYEEFPVAVDFSESLTAGETIVDIAVVASDAKGSDATVAVTVPGTAGISENGVVSITVMGGERSLQPYKLTFRCETSLGNKWEKDISMRVVDL